MRSLSSAPARAVPEVDCSFTGLHMGTPRLPPTPGPPPLELARTLFETSRIACDCADNIQFLSPAWLKLACNLLPVGAGALPRGGRLVLGDRPLTLQAIGETATLSHEALAALMLATPVDELNARTVQPYFAGLLAKALDCGLMATTEPGRVRLTVVATPR